jgi:hypothetical protein
MADDTHDMGIDALEEEIEESIDAPRGMLTSTDREFLFEQTQEDNDRTHRSRLHRIRTRARAAIFDFIYLDFYLSDSEIAKVFRESDEPHRPTIWGAASVLNTILYGLEAAATAHIERALEDAIYRRHLSEGEFLPVDVSVTIETGEPVTLETLYTRWKAGEDLPPEHYRALVEAGFPVDED